MNETGDGGAFRSGFVAIVGRPNVGKSTFLNAVIGQKVTIVSDKPQTTRNKIQAVWTTGNAQIVFLDTPGMHRPQDRLGESMMRAAEEALEEVDAVLFVVDGAAGPGRGDRKVAERLEGLGTPVVLAVNKVDLLRGDERRGRVAPFEELGSFHAVRAISAATGEGVAELLDLLVALLPEGPKYYPDDWVSDHPERFIVAELIREKVLELTYDEVPHSVAVAVENMARREGKDLVAIEATIYVERESQKGILIGKEGARLREIGTRARQEMEALLGSRIYLNLWVKVSPKWRERESVLRSLGYN